MKKMVKYLTLGIALQMLCSSCMTNTALAGGVESPTEFSGVLSMFIQKLEKINAYKDEIQKTLDVKSSFGDLNINATTKMLSQMSGLMGPFQDSLHFGELAGSINSVTSQVNSVTGEVSDLKHEIDGLSNQVQQVSSSLDGTLNKATDAVLSGAVQGAISGDVTQAVAASAASGISDGTSSQSETAGEGGSSASRVKTITGSYGEPQTSQETAQKYVKDTFFYSTREGDKATGTVLTETDLALEKVNANRGAYYHEVVASSLAEANEAIATNYSESQKRMEDLMSKAQSAKTYDDKKAVEVAIMQNDMRERMIRLSLELAILEQDTVTMLLSEPANYLIPRSADEIRAETEEQMEEINLEKEESGV